MRRRSDRRRPEVGDRFVQFLSSSEPNSGATDTLTRGYPHSRFSGTRGRMSDQPERSSPTTSEMGSSEAEVVSRQIGVRPLADVGSADFGVSQPSENVAELIEKQEGIMGTTTGAPKEKPPPPSVPPESGRKWGFLGEDFDVQEGASEIAKESTPPARETPTGGESPRQHSLSLEEGTPPVRASSTPQGGDGKDPSFPSPDLRSSQTDIAEAQIQLADLQLPEGVSLRTLQPVQLPFRSPLGHPLAMIGLPPRCRDTYTQDNIVVDLVTGVILESPKRTPVKWADLQATHRWCTWRAYKWVNRVPSEREYAVSVRVVAEMGVTPEPKWRFPGTNVTVNQLQQNTTDKQGRQGGMLRRVVLPRELASIWRMTSVQFDPMLGDLYSDGYRLEMMKMSLEYDGGSLPPIPPARNRTSPALQTESHRARYHLGFHLPDGRKVGDASTYGYPHVCSHRGYRLIQMGASSDLSGHFNQGLILMDTHTGELYRTTGEPTEVEYTLLQATMQPPASLGPLPVFPPVHSQSMPADQPPKALTPAPSPPPPSKPARSYSDLLAELNTDPETSLRTPWETGAQSLEKALAERPNDGQGQMIAWFSASPAWMFDIDPDSAENEHEKKELLWLHAAWEVSRSRAKGRGFLPRELCPPVTHPTMRVALTPRGEIVSDEEGRPIMQYGVQVDRPEWICLDPFGQVMRTANGALRQPICNICGLISHLAVDCGWPRECRRRGWRMTVDNLPEICPVCKGLGHLAGDPGCPKRMPLRTIKRAEGIQPHPDLVAEEVEERESDRTTVHSLSDQEKTEPKETETESVRRSETPKSELERWDRLDKEAESRESLIDKAVQPLTPTSRTPSVFTPVEGRRTPAFFDRSGERDAQEDSDMRISGPDSFQPQPIVLNVDGQEKVVKPTPQKRIHVLKRHISSMDSPVRAQARIPRTAQKDKENLDPMGSSPELRGPREAQQAGDPCSHCGTTPHAYSHTRDHLRTLEQVSVLQHQGVEDPCSTCHTERGVFRACIHLPRGVTVTPRQTFSSEPCATCEDHPVGKAQCACRVTRVAKVFCGTCGVRLGTVPQKHVYFCPRATPCQKCRGVDHPTEVCRLNPAQLEAPAIPDQCMYCGDEDHRSQFCTNAPHLIRNEQDHGYCELCASPTHVTWRCRVHLQPEPTDMYCFICQSTQHLTMDHEARGQEADPSRQEYRTVQPSEVPQRTSSVHRSQSYQASRGEERTRDSPPERSAAPFMGAPGGGPPPPGPPGPPGGGPPDDEPDPNEDGDDEDDEEAEERRGRPRGRPRPWGQRMGHSASPQPLARRFQPALPPPARSTATMPGARSHSAPADRTTEILETLLRLEQGREERDRAMQNTSIRQQDTIADIAAQTRLRNADVLIKTLDVLKEDSYQKCMTWLSDVEAISRETGLEPRTIALQRSAGTVRQVIQRFDKRAKWGVISTEIRRCFSDAPTYIQAMLKLRRMKQKPGQAVAVFANEYGNMFYWATGILLRNALSKQTWIEFLFTLRNASVRDKVNKRKPKSLQDAFEWATHFEIQAQEQEALNAGSMGISEIEHPGRMSEVHEVRSPSRQSNACFNCGVLGHFQKDCPQLKNPRNRTPGGYRSPSDNPVVGSRTQTLVSKEDIRKSEWEEMLGQYYQAKVKAKTAAKLAEAAQTPHTPTTPRTPLTPRTAQAPRSPGNSTTPALVQQSPASPQLPGTPRTPVAPPPQGTPRSQTSVKRQLNMSTATPAASPPTPVRIAPRRQTRRQTQQALQAGQTVTQYQLAPVEEEEVLLAEAGEEGDCDGTDHAELEEEEPWDEAVETQD